jgi:hypothetical protein
MTDEWNFVLIGDIRPSSRASSVSSLAVEPYGVRSLPLLKRETSAVERFVREWIPVMQTITLDELLKSFDSCDHNLAATTDDVLPMLSVGERVFL